MTVTAVDDLWAGAACREPGIDPEMFFPERGAHPSLVEQARAVCDRCPIRQRCGEYAMELESRPGYRSMRFGVWGGLSPKQRAKLARRAGR